ncbi:uncharacterized protein LOC141629212 [Silene latifolia]|uniref:uncharacterized protein LOC141629212 n=1 Tax=Silene latifolia TaxID=37657 RepID=UPI003D7711A0
MWEKRQNEFVCETISWLFEENFNLLVTWNITSRVQKAKADLQTYQKHLTTDPLSSRLIHEERVLIFKYSKLKSSEHAIFQQRAKLKHIQEDDSCSKYFFAKIAERKYQQIIGGIKDHHCNMHTGLEEVGQAFPDYYKSLLGTKTVTSPLDSSFFDSGPSLSSKDQQSLIAKIFDQDIKNAVFSIDSNSSPVSKILSHRLQQVLPSLVGGEQATFIKGRNIFGNIMISQCLVKGHKRKNISRCLIKVDIKKTFELFNGTSLIIFSKSMSLLVLSETG